tara:strand:+ start:545 stop:844 length:300 start_codon:yes stop_codon:yes gene_type:complete
MKTFWVYIIYCCNDSYYTGYTDDLIKRYQKHLRGSGSKYTRSFKPIHIAQCWEVNNKSQALKLEKQIKKLSKADKVKVILNPDCLLTSNDIKVGVIPNS